MEPALYGGLAKRDIVKYLWLNVCVRRTGRKIEVFKEILKGVENGVSFSGFNFRGNGSL